MPRASGMVSVPELSGGTVKLQHILGGVLAVVTYIQLEANLSHALHLSLASVAVFLGYILGYNTEPKKAEENVVKL